MGKQKNKSDVRGWQIDCIRYNPCPLCYGCREYDSKYVKCEECGRNKRDICNLKLHTERNLSKMISREVINLDK